MARTLYVKKLEALMGTKIIRFFEDKVEIRKGEYAAPISFTKEEINLLVRLFELSRKFMEKEVIDEETYMELRPASRYSETVMGSAPICPERNEEETK